MNGGGRAGKGPRWVGTRDVLCFESQVCLLFIYLFTILTKTYALGRRLEVAGPENSCNG